MLRKTKLTSVAPPVQTVLWLCVPTWAMLPTCFVQITAGVSCVVGSTAAVELF